MPSINNLTESEERILLALWKLKGIGSNHVRVDYLAAELAELSGDRWTEDVVKLQTQGFVDTVTDDDHNAISLTPLGLAILRQIEEDRLQELK